jgi:hypothetical protein
MIRSYRMSKGTSTGIRRKNCSRNSKRTRGVKVTEAEGRKEKVRVIAET